MKVPLLRTKSNPEPESVAPSAGTAPDPRAADQRTADQRAAKGRPTPKRRDSEVRQGPVAPAPKTRREALARQRTLAKTAQSSPRGGGATALTAAERRQRLQAGDPAYLPRRDAGPLRALARDYVDSHRMFSNLLLLLFPISLLTVLARPLGSHAIGALNFVVVALLLVVFAEWVFTGRRVLAIAKERGIDPGRDGALQIGAYAGMRAYLPRRWRLPRARVGRGAKI